MAGVTCFAAEQPGEEESEIRLSSQEIKRLNVFEDRALSKADASFARQEYAEAGKQYGSFLQEHPQSRVAAYALFRIGRCAQLDGKLPEAIVQYEQVAKRFPKAVTYAVPALFHVAECHVADGALDEAVKAWARIAEDPEYGKSALAASAVAKLAAALAKQGKPGEAISYYERIADSLDDCNEELAELAIDAVVRQHVRIEPDEAKLRQFYKKIRAVQRDPGEDPAYWQWVQQGVLANGSFTWSEKEQGKAYFESWVGTMEGKFPNSDDFQIGMAALRYEVDRDKDKLAESLDKQFEKFQKEGDWKRVLKWVRAYKGNWTKTREYVGKITFATSGVEGVTHLLDLLCKEQQESYLAKSAFQKYCESVPFAETSNEDIHKLILLAHEVLEDRTTAGSLAGKLKLDGMPDAARLQLARKLLKLDGVIAEQVYNRLEDKHAGQMELLEHYYQTGDVARALPIADALASVEKYARGVQTKKAELLFKNQRYSEAIAAYQQAADPPSTLWQIVACHEAMEDVDKAVLQLQEIERGFKDQASKAAYRIACLYRDAEEKQKYIASLRDLIKKYPNSAEADKAEEEKDELGVPPAMPAEPFRF
ncbi:MAG: tetratricopeptide repeat protein [Candidatus Nealsonbacteria bacterium]|nr:tetratricopeptide repeat protein [Candidatus Nealsonbacteria bacterium]